MCPPGAEQVCCIETLSAWDWGPSCRVWYAAGFMSVSYIEYFYLLPFRDVGIASLLYLIYAPSFEVPYLRACRWINHKSTFKLRKRAFGPIAFLSDGVAQTRVEALHLIKARLLTLSLNNLAKLAPITPQNNNPNPHHHHIPQPPEFSQK